MISIVPHLFSHVALTFRHLSEEIDCDENSQGRLVSKSFEFMSKGCELTGIALLMFFPLILQVVIFLILLVWWLDLPKQEDSPYQVVEYFAGVERVASLAKHCHFSSAAVDVLYGQEGPRKPGKRRPLDLNGSAGLACL